MPYGMQILGTSAYGWLQFNAGGIKNVSATSKLTKPSSYF